MNTMPQMKDGLHKTFIEALSETDELDIFKCPAVLDMIKYKWINYARHIHIFGLINHILYFIIHSCYVIHTYVLFKDHEEHIMEMSFDTLVVLDRTFLILLSVLLIYPLIYDMTQFKK